MIHLAIKIQKTCLFKVVLILPDSLGMTHKTVQILILSCMVMIMLNPNLLLLWNNDSLVEDVEDEVLKQMQLMYKRTLPNQYTSYPYITYIMII